MPKKCLERLENFFYGTVVRQVLLLSEFGRRSIGDANSGNNFDYMYRNQPSGNGICRLVDFVLLNLKGVKATRKRKETIKRLLRQEENPKLNILDIASGPARYLVELVEEGKRDVSCLCLDIDERCLEYGRRLVFEKGLEQNIEYRRVDVFNRKDMGALEFKPDVIVVSGLYVYHDDELVSQSLRILSDLLETEGRIIVDNQISNPNKKLMEKVCKTMDGKPWELFYRTREEMRNLMSPFFKDMGFYIDKWGMYDIARGIKRQLK